MTLAAVGGFRAVGGARTIQSMTTALQTTSGHAPGARHAPGLLAVAAGLSTLAKLDPGAYGRLGTATGRLAAGIREAAAGRPVQVSSLCGLLTVFFSPEPVRDFAAASACDLDAYARFCRALLGRGVYPPPSQFEAWFVSLAHDEATIDRTIEAVAAAMDEALSP